MSKPSQARQFRGVPQAVVAEYHRQVDGNRRTLADGTVIVEKDCSDKDEETMLRLLADIGLWADISEILQHDDARLIMFFNSAWVAALNYDHFRFLSKVHETGRTIDYERRRNGELKKLAGQIKGTAEKLAGLLNEMSHLGNTPGRYPDNALNSPKLQDELAWLIEKAKKFDASSIHSDEFINTAISKQEKNHGREYVRGFITLLADFNFPFGHPKARSVIAAAATAATSIDGGVTYNDVYAALQDLAKKSGM